ncbi:MAG: hypothetical protein RBR86_02140 [Pseudobdellovibrionaceae bacterium]|jgi:hypothetical protein|nr:hypothetical protein [Pseudobdellovibrionaceae bacterium]
MNVSSVGNSYLAQISQAKPNQQVPLQSAMMSGAGKDSDGDMDGSSSASSGRLLDISA